MNPAQIEAALQAVAELAADYVHICRVEPDGSMALEWASPGFAEYAGYEPGKLPRGDAWAAIVHPDDRGLLDACRGELVCGESHRCEFRIVPRNGGVRWVRHVARPVWDDDHRRVVAVYGAGVDITELKQTEAMLADSQARMNALLDTVPAVVYSCGPAPVFPTTYISSNVAAHLGYGALEFLEDEYFWTNRVHPEDRDRVLAVLAAMDGQTSLSYEYRFLHRDGRYVWLHDQFKPIAGTRPDEIIGIAGSWVDISERKLTEDALRESEQRYRTLAETAQDAIFVISRNDTVSYVNTAAAAFLGCEPADLIGRPRSELFSGEESRKQWEDLWGVMQSGKPVPPIESRVTYPGGARWQTTALSPILDQRGEVTAVLGVSRDITTRKRAEEELRQAHAELEQRVAERTADLRATNQRLEQEIVERERAESALRESEERFRQLAENCDEVFWLTDWQDQKLLYVSPLYERVFGRPVQELREDRQSWLAAVHPEDRDRVAKAFRSGADLGEYVDEEYRILRGDGSVRWIRDRAIPILDERGATDRVVGIAADITKRKIAEEALRASEEKLRSTLVSMSDLVFVLDQHGRYVDFHQPEGHADLYTPPAAFLGRAYAEVLPQSVSRLYDEAIARAIETGDVQHVEYPLEIGGKTTWFSARVSIRRDHAGNSAGVTKVVRNISEQKQTVDALRESESRYRAIVQDQSEFICRWLPGFTHTFVNDAYCRALGKAREELIGQSFLPFIPENEHDSVIRRFAALTPEHPVATHEHGVINAAGETRYHQWTDRAILGDDGEIVEYQSVGRDITEQRLAAEALRRSEANLIEAQRIAQIGNWYYYQKTNELYWSDEIFRMLGCDPAEERHRSAEARKELFLSRIHPDDRDRFLQEIGRYFRERDSLDIELRVVWPDGTVRYLHDRGEVTCNDAGDVVRTAGTIQDVTDRKRAELALRRRDSILNAISFTAERLLKHHDWRASVNEVLRRLGESAEVSRAYVFENHTDANGVEVVSQRFEWAAPGVAPQIDNPNLQSIGWQEGGFGRWQPLLRRGEVIHGHVVHFPESERGLLESQNIASIAAVPIFSELHWWGFLGVDACGNPREWSRAEIEALQVAADTLGAAMQRQQSEEQIRRHQNDLEHVSRLAMLGELSSGIAHEINQPLAAIHSFARGCVRRLKSGTGDPAEISDVIDKIAVQAERAGSIIERMRGFVKKRSPHLVSTNINYLVTEALRFVEHETREWGVAVRVVADESLRPVLADSVQIEQVILNLVRNGIEAMTGNTPDHRVLTIRTSNAGSDAVACSIEDVGPGISRTAAEQIFEPFYSTKNGGMGLGLSISRTIVEAHGGRLWVDSSPNAGAKLLFTLPVADQEAPR